MSNTFITQFQRTSIEDSKSYSKTLSTPVKGTTELLSMSLTDLQAYSTTLADTILHNTMVIQQNQRKQSIIANNIILSQSTSYGYRYQIINNNNRLLAYNTQYAEVLENNSTIDGKIEIYTRRINDDTSKLQGFKNLIGGLQIQACSISTTLNGSSFVDRAKYYSSLYINYMVADSLYNDCINSTIELNSAYDESVKIEKEAYSDLVIRADDILTKTTELTRLYKEKAVVQSTVTGHRINEALYTNAYNSTTAGLNAISSLFEIASLFSNYNSLVIAEQKNMESYSTAYKYYTLLDGTNNTVSGATSAGWLSFMSTLSATESTITAKITNTSNSIINSLAKNETIWVSTANAAIDTNNITESSLQIYATLAESSFQYYSTLNGYANTRLLANTNEYLANMSSYNGYVNTSNSIISSMIAASTLESTMFASELDMRARIRESFVSTYKHSIEYSTLMTDIYTSSVDNYNYYSEIYDSTSKNIVEVNTLLNDTMTSTYNIIAKINTFSTILDIATMNVNIFDIESRIHYTMEEMAAMQYRQSYVISKRMDAKQIYENCVLTQVQQTQTQTPITTTIIPAAVNLAVNSIATAYINLNTVNLFLNRFDSIYYGYTTHIGNLCNFSTLIGNKAKVYSSLTTYRQQSYLNPDNVSIASALTDAQTKLEELTSIMENSSLMLSTSELTIQNDKLNFMNIYVNTFPAPEIIQTESTISSFLEAGYKMSSQ